jgi:hypothetical protein
MNLESLFEQVNPKLFPEPTIRTLFSFYQFLQLGGYFYRVKTPDFSSWRLSQELVLNLNQTVPKDKFRVFSFI